MLQLTDQPLPDRTKRLARLAVSVWLELPPLREIDQWRQRHTSCWPRTTRIFLSCIQMVSFYAHADVSETSCSSGRRYHVFANSARTPGGMTFVEPADSGRSIPLKTRSSSRPARAFESAASFSFSCVQSTHPTHQLYPIPKAQSQS